MNFSLGCLIFNLALFIHAGGDKNADRVPTVRGMKCHYCTGVTNPMYCAEMIRCGPQEECFSDMVVGEMGNLFYNSGCRHRYICMLLATNKHRRRNQLPVCEECCGNDGCNKNLCLEKKNETRPSCYACNNVKTPYECTNKVLCREDEICLTEEYIDDNFTMRYKMGCETDTRCNLVTNLGRRRQVATCIECCPHSGCNRHLCFEDSGATTTASKLSTATTIPSTEMTSTVATQPSSGSTLTRLTTSTSTPSTPSTPGISTAQPLTGSTITQSTTATSKASTLTTPTSTTTQPSTTIPSTTHRTSTAPVVVSSTCTDAPFIKCKDINASMHLCSIPTGALKYCAKFCGACKELSSGTQPPVVPTSSTEASTTPTTPPTSTPLVTSATQGPQTACVDEIEDCAQFDSFTQACKKKETAAKTICPKYCGLCSAPTATSAGATPTSSTDAATVTTTTATTTTVTSTSVATVCMDKPGIDCADLIKSTPICDSITQASMTYCMKSCNFCKHGN